METKKEVDDHTYEKYCFYRLYSIDFDSVLHSIKILKRYKRKDVRYCILRDLVVAYSRPFFQNKGERLLKHNLNTIVVPKDKLDLHNELLRLRKEQFAHTDYTFNQPKVLNWSTDQVNWFPMSFRGYDYLKLDNQVEEIEKLVKAVELKLHLLIDKIENEFNNS